VNWNRHLRIRQAASQLWAGGLVAYPTEAVWGLGCDPDNALAVHRLLELKARPMGKGVILIAASLEQLLPYMGSLTAAEWQRLDGPARVPTTWVVPASASAPYWITGGRPSVAVRITRHPLASALCSAFGGALVSTSANPGGKPPARSQLKVRQYFRGAEMFIVPGPLGGSTKPSEIRDLRSGAVIRQGGGDK
jgi:L-threonylcarbamoyladenylate synthase